MAEVTLGFQLVEREVRKSMLAAYPTEVDLVSRTLALTHEAFEWLHGKHIGRQWHALVLMLAARTFSSLLVAHDALLSGYPEQAIILVRAVDEDVLTATYVGRHPREARFWLARKYSAPKYWGGKASQVIPSFDKMRTDLGKDQSVKLREIYGVLSQFGHPKAAGLRLIVSGTGEATTYRAGPAIDHDAAFAAYYVLLPAAISALPVAGQFVAGKDEDWRRRAESVKEDVIGWLEEQNAAAAARRTAPPPRP